MASTSYSSIKKSFTYDVFLSFRGEDTRKNFVDHLYHALQQKNINTYIDDEEIKKGKRINDELIKSIEDSKSYIIVFSKNYASSSWCLDELVKIMECQKTNEHTAYPVFYDVEPTEVRKQSGSVGEAFSKHKVEEEGAKKWIDALRQAADLAGWDLKTTFDGHEAECIQKIVKEISLELSSIDLSVDGKLIGIKTRVRDVISSLEIDTDDVRMIGIKGIGGGGKTTLARAVFDQISFMFEGSSFIENVREVSKGSFGGLKSLQKQLLADVLLDPDIIVKGVSDFKRVLSSRKVLVVLDDADHVNQLEALAGELNWFKLGSRIIITTREEQVLLAHGVLKNLILDVNLLSHEEATCLFNKYAFGRMIPSPGYHLLSKQVVRYAAGLPLTLKVLGSSLRGNDESVWKSALERLKTIPLKETMEILEFSYESLEEDYKEIFLDVACILKGWKKEHAITALESRGFNATNGLRVLEQKSLITVSRFGDLISMHDHIEEMGKDIVRRLHPNEPSRHSRLWNQNEIEDILVKNKAGKRNTYDEATRCIKMWRVDPVSVMKGLRKMKELKFLDVKCKALYDIKHTIGVGGPMKEILSLEAPSRNEKVMGPILGIANIKRRMKFVVQKRKSNMKHHDESRYKDTGEDSLYLPNSLQYLRWEGYPFKRLPKKFHGNNLVGLTIDHANIDQLWKGNERKVLKNLRFLTLSGCKFRSLDITLIPNLERLTLVQCDDLVDIRIPVNSSKLRYLNLYNYQSRTLNLERTHNLDTLKMTRLASFVGGNLRELRMPFERLNFKHLALPACYMLKTPNLMRYQNLETLDLDCIFMVELHFPVESLTHLCLRHFNMKTLNLMLAWKLKRLILVNCEGLLELRMPIENTVLEIINVWCPKLRALNLDGCRNLETLEVKQCMELVELFMPTESTKLKIVKISGSKLITLNLTKYRNLETLHLHQCKDLVELHMPFESPELKSINIHCFKLRSLNLIGYQNLKSLELKRCDDLVELHMPIKSLKLISVIICCSKLRTLHLGLYPYRKVLILSDCISLVEVHAIVGCKSGYVRFKSCLDNKGFPMLGSSVELHLIARSLAICPLHPENNLPKFHFECIYEEFVPVSTQNIQNLITNIGICVCVNLASLSKSICGLQRLRKLTLEGSIPAVPKEIDQLDCLEEVTLLSTDVVHLPSSICMLKHLKVLQLKSCWFLQQLPEDIGRLECLEELRLMNCISLRDIPDSICEMKRLKCFHLINCFLVEKFPTEIGRLKCLKELTIQGTAITDIPQSLFELEDLVFLF